MAKSPSQEARDKFYYEHLKREIELLQKENKELKEENIRLKSQLNGNRKQVKSL